MSVGSQERRFRWSVGDSMPNAVLLLEAVRQARFALVDGWFNS
jgi:hypothetical protein